MSDLSLPHCKSYDAMPSGPPRRDAACCAPDLID